jgi:hypothetical protein
LSVVYTWAAANNRIHHRRIAPLLLHFAAAGSREGPDCLVWLERRTASDLS